MHVRPQMFKCNCYNSIAYHEIRAIYFYSRHSVTIVITARNERRLWRGTDTYICLQFWILLTGSIVWAIGVEYAVARWRRANSVARNNHTNFRSTGITSAILCQIGERRKYEIVNIWPALTTCGQHITFAWCALRYHVTHVRLSGSTRMLYASSRNTATHL